MASEGTDGEDRQEEAHQPRECMPCRGSGKVISNLGGAPSEVACPWCEGGGVRLSGIDAQAKWGGGSGREAQAAEDPMATDAAEDATTQDTAA